MTLFGHFHLIASPYQSLLVTVPFICVCRQEFSSHHVQHTGVKLHIFLAPKGQKTL